MIVPPSMRLFLPPCSGCFPSNSHQIIPPLCNRFQSWSLMSNVDINLQAEIFVGIFACLTDDNVAEYRRRWGDQIGRKGEIRVGVVRHIGDDLKSVTQSTGIQGHPRKSWPFRMEGDISDRQQGSSSCWIHVWIVAHGIRRNGARNRRRGKVKMLDFEKQMTTSLKRIQLVIKK